MEKFTQRKKLKMSNRVEHTKKALLSALEKTMGVVTSACNKVGVSRSTFYSYYNSDKKFRDAVDDTSETALDFAESKLFSLIQSENPTAIIFYLKTKGKHRGYIERQEHDHSVKEITITAELDE